MLLVEKENRRKLVKLVLNRLSFISSVPSGFKIFALALESHAATPSKHLTRQESDRVPFVITFNPTLPNKEKPFNRRDKQTRRNLIYYMIL